MSDISNILKGTSLALEREAFNQFGAAIEGQVRNLSSLGKNRPNTNDPNGPLPSPNSPINAAQAAEGAEYGVWEPTKYAAALTQAEQGALDPKQKFLFKVTFWFDETIQTSGVYGSLANGNDSSSNELSRTLTYMVKQIDLPSVQFDYEEVNMYNYRTKVLKSISHKELNFSFMDDIGNGVMDFVNIYRMLLQPMARQDNPSWESAEYSDYGFAFSDGMGVPDSSFRGALPGNARRILRKIVIHQFYVNRGAGMDGTVEQMIKTNDFIFLNPQLMEMDMGELDHENGNSFNLITANFAFDGLVVKPAQSVFENGVYKHKDISLDVRDMLTGPSNSTQVNRGQPSITAGGGKPNPFSQIIANQAGRIVQGAASNALQKAFGGIAGGALSGTINQITGALGNAARNTISGNTQAIARPTTSYVRDPSVSRAEADDNSNRQSSNITIPPGA